MINVHITAKLDTQVSAEVSMTTYRQANCVSNNKPWSKNNILTHHCIHIHLFNMVKSVANFIGQNMFYC